MSKTALAETPETSPAAAYKEAVAVQDKRIKKQAVQIVLDSPFFASLLLRMPIKADPSKGPTFCTDGRLIYYNPTFAASLADHEIRGILGHEVLHCSNGHLWRFKDRDPRISNHACDHAVNLFLEEYNKEQESAGRPRPFPLPAGGLCDPRFTNMSAEEIYRILEQEQQAKPPKQKSQPHSGSSGQNGGPSDPDSDDPQEDNDDPQEDKAEDTGPGEFTQPATNDDGSTTGNTEADWAIATAQAHQAAKMMGKGSGCLDRMVGELTAPTVDWRAMLDKFVRAINEDDTSWQVRDRRFPVDIMPGMWSEKVGKIMVVVDTSGSITPDLLTAFLSEIQGILDTVKPEALVVMYADDRVQTVENFSPGDSVVISQPSGYGGTDFRPAFDYTDKMPEAPECLIYLTDLYGEFPASAPSYPVLWCVIPGGGGEVPWGEHVKMQ